MEESTHTISGLIAHTTVHDECFLSTHIYIHTAIIYISNVFQATFPATLFLSTSRKLVFGYARLRKLRCLVWGGSGATQRR